jgi:hypothetical protein
MHTDQGHGINRAMTPGSVPRYLAGIFERFRAGAVCRSIPRMIPSILFPVLCVALVLLVVIDCRACGRD